jgi:hypothetical protein
MNGPNETLSRQELIRLAIIYAAGRNSNMPSHVRRILAQKFNLDVQEVEVEAECQQLAGETVKRLAQLAPTIAAWGRIVAKAYRFLEFTRLPLAKADLARDAEAFKEACERAQRKGDKAMDLLDSPECNPDPALVREWARDFEVKNGW